MSCRRNILLIFSKVKNNPLCMRVVSQPRFVTFALFTLRKKLFSEFNNGRYLVGVSYTSESHWYKDKV